MPWYLICLIFLVTHPFKYTTLATPYVFVLNMPTYFQNHLIHCFFLCPPPWLFRLWIPILDVAKTKLCMRVKAKIACFSHSCGCVCFLCCEDCCVVCMFVCRPDVIRIKCYYMSLQIWANHKRCIFKKHYVSGILFCFTIISVSDW